MPKLPKEIDLQVISIFENYSVEHFENGHVILKTEVTDSALNYYGNAHGGYLFTLCDQVGGLVARSTGQDAVTLQANANYLKAGHKGDLLTIEGKLVHGGRSTQLIEVVIYNQKEQVLTKVGLTMFVVKKS
ncbi:PaaI family thioesterase [Streptococcus dysgalactiae]|uniref:PaaI family thioesterase n=1 Tax=Streptococcus dysgalactiae subsp. dysgalactiae TaxID=99822 RepID=A0A9X7S2C4_STRDY|nr:PaaI family thioesterase [Streptococcus dysgalactiae]QGG98698.1 PaaI family thioesterase [Streptococcus dysgalactiae subsp. dysgalactiae]QGH02261.1 PaaI family thioesterase [Streptococcus dysgalactiae subsp. dysgalactiae]